MSLRQPGETKPVQILKMAPAGFTGRPTPIIIKTTNPAAAGAQQTILVASAARAPPEAPAREEAPPTLYATNMSAVHYIDTGGEVYVTSGDTGIQSTLCSLYVTARRLTSTERLVLMWMDVWSILREH